MADDPFPDLPEDRLSADGWRLEERTVETVFSLPGLRVEGRTLLYEQPDLRERVRGATDGRVDQPWRFVFATRLVFSPPLAPGIGPLSLFPTVHSEACRAFVADLRERGFDSIRRGRAQRMRTDSGDRARLTKYTAGFETEAVAASLEAWFAVWIHEGEYRLAGGAYPVDGLSAVGTDVAPARYREELLALLRDVR
jgi:hypothetical protein